VQGATGPRRRKQNKCLGSSKADPNFILGEDLSMVGVAAMADKTLVGKAYGRQFSEKTLRAWATSNWGANSISSPNIFRLSRGWFMIIFSEPSQALVVLQKSWAIDSSPVLMKLWNPTFDVASERLDSILIWVRLPGLPPHLWSENCFQAIGNFLGEYLTADMGFLDTGRDVSGKNSGLSKHQGRATRIPQPNRFGMDKGPNSRL
jgi:hypothetical protein